MAFQTKNFVSIVAAMCNVMRSATVKINDFQPGSVARTLVEGPASEIEEAYQQFFIGLREAIPYATFRSFGFDKLPSTRARGFVTVSSSAPRTSDLLIPLGTEFRTIDSRVYTSVSDVTWATGSSLVLVLVEADRIGVAGNAAPSTITSSSFFGSSPVTISNQGINTGKDAESDAEQEARFAEFINALSRGTVDACMFAAQQAVLLDTSGAITEFITRAGMVEAAGFVRIYVYSSRGLPSAELLADGQRRIDGSRDELTGNVVTGFRAAGVRITLLPMAERQIDMAVLVTMLPGQQLTSVVIQRLSDIFATAIVGVQPNETLSLGTLVAQLLTVTGVREIVPLGSGENIFCDANEALVPGNFTANQA